MRQEDAELSRLSRVKRTERTASPTFGPDLIDFFKQSIARRQTKFAKIGECWSQVVPESFCEHTALESFTKGVLTVVVDSASYQYELKQLLLAGVEQQLLFACKSAGLRKIILKRGRWYDGEGAAKKIRF